MVDTACGIETSKEGKSNTPLVFSCNNTYRLRYAQKGARQQRSKVMMRAALLLPERREGKTKVIRQQFLPFTVLKLVNSSE